MPLGSRLLSRVGKIIFHDDSNCLQLSVTRLKMDWELAAKHADLLFDQCNWSRATFVYMKAAFLYMKMIDENRPEDMEEQISQLFKSVVKQFHLKLAC